MPDSFRSVISRWPSLADFADDIGVVENTAKQMKKRDSIPHVYWACVVTGAKQRGLKGVTLEALAQLADRRRRAA